MPYCIRFKPVKEIELELGSKYSFDLWIVVTFIFLILGSSSQVKPSSANWYYILYDLRNATFGVEYFRNPLTSSYSYSGNWHEKKDSYKGMFVCRSFQEHKVWLWDVIGHSGELTSLIHTSGCPRLHFKTLIACSNIINEKSERGERSFIFCWCLAYSILYLFYLCNQSALGFDDELIGYSAA